MAENTRNAHQGYEWSDEDIYMGCTQLDDTIAEQKTDDKPSDQKTADEQYEYTAVKASMIPAVQHSGETDSSDDNIPLTELRKKWSQPHKRKPVKRKLLDDDILEYESDNSLNDESYNPCKDTVNSSDSEYADITKERRKKQRSIKDARNTAWKKKISTCKSATHVTKKDKSKTHKLYEQLKSRINVLKARRAKQNDEVEKAKRLSKKMQSVKSHIRRIHTNRLDQLLASNELQRVPVAADGNCFFTVMAKSINDPLLSDTGAFRNTLCDFMLENIQTYMKFLTESGNADQAEQFKDGVQSLRNSGVWNANIADLLPRVVADKFRCTVRIYSSSLQTPVIDVKSPESLEAKDQAHRIDIAHLAIRNEEHYEATKPISSFPITDKTDCNDGAKEPGYLTPSEHVAEPGKQIESKKQTCSTPHKRTDYQSPSKMQRSRKRKRNEKNWKCNVRKNLRCAGQAYISKTGKTIEQKKLKPHHCEKCKFKCSIKFNEEERKEILENYYSLPTYERQRSFICDMVSKETPSRNKKGKRQTSLKYFLTIGIKRERVCKDFFMNTLDIGRKVISYTLERKQHGMFSGADMRGRSAPSSKISNEIVKNVRDHINSFPKMESHYARKSTKKHFLAQDLNIKKMWTLYTEECKQKGIKPVTEGKYRQIFCEDFNLSFFKPKKDQCSLCAKYTRHQQSDTLTNDLKHEFKIHQERKVEAREEKERVKKLAQTTTNHYVATFDLQAVLTTPCCLVSELYYSRKLSCYNLTIYSLGDKHVSCHVWDETQGKRGACEIATCLLKNTQSVCSSAPVEDITYYSDACSGQNRNKYVAASYLYSISKIPQLKTINHKFLQTGHTQMECDSVHSAIETAKKKTSVYVPSQWSTVICLSRKTNPYITIPLKYDHVIDFKAFVEKHCINFKTTTGGDKVNWLKVRWIQVRQNDPKTLFVNYTFDSKNFMEIVSQPSMSTRKGRAPTWPKTDSEMDLCYSSKLPVSVQKKSDLVSLCTKGIIPDDFHGYFMSLTTSGKMKDTIPVSSDEDDTD